MSFPVRAVLEGLRSRIASGARRTHRVVESRFRRVLDESAEPSCCAVEKAAHVRSLVHPAPGDPAPHGTAPAGERDGHPGHSRTSQGGP